MSATPRIGLLGGTFDPVHFGHLILAEDAQRHAGLDRVHFLPAYSAPLRWTEAVAGPEQRLDLLARAIAEFPRFQVDDFEVRQGRRVYSVETARHFRALFPTARLYFLIGADQLERLPEWKDIGELRQLVVFLCAQRYEDEPLRPPEGCEIEFEVLPARRIDISATEIRQLFANGQPCRSLLPRSVADAIEARNLYRPD